VAVERSPMKCRRIAFLLALGLAFPLGGCGAGAVGLVFGIRSLLDRGGDAIDLPPHVGEIRVSAPEGPDRIRVDFEVVNEDEGRLSARVEF